MTDKLINELKNAKNHNMAENTVFPVIYGHIIIQNLYFV